MGKKSKNVFIFKRLNKTVNMNKIIISLLALSMLLSCGNDNTSEKNINNTETVDAKESINTMSEADLVAKILELEKNLIDPNTELAKEQESIELLESVKKLSERFPDVENGEALKYKGILAARGLNKPYEALRLFDQLIKEYPKSEKVIGYKFEKAVLLQDNLNGKEEARKIYEELAKNHPEHPFGRDSKAILATIDMTDEELINFLTSKNAK